jgi:hypothetical protein
MVSPKLAGEKPQAWMGRYIREGNVAGGKQVWLQPGSHAASKVILNPADSLVTGDVVRVAATPAPSPAPAVAKK